MKSRRIGLVFVLIFSVFFAIRQYQPGTWLMGWDSLHPEFNYNLAFSRVFSGAWRESQGLGAVAVHSHMSELPRIMTLWVIDLFVHSSTVRWTYVLLMLAWGVMGAYVLLVHILARMRGALGMRWVVLVAIAGSMAYLFNLSTLHHFLVPFEMFVVLFGLLPWSLWSVSRYLQVSNRDRMVVFLLIQFLISSCAFAATLWVVYFGALVLTTWFLTKNKRLWIKVLVLTLMVNSYWLLPTMYGLVTTGGVVASAKINQIFSPEAWLNNVAYGTAQQVMRLESFILQWMSFDRVNDKFDLVVSQWARGVNQSYVWLMLNVIGGMVCFGIMRWIYLSVVKGSRESRRWSGLVIVGLIFFLMMLSGAWPVSSGLEWAREQLPLVGELLRTPFTKVSIFLQLTYVLLISVGLLWFVEKVRFSLVRVMIILATVAMMVIPFTSWIIKGDLMGDVVVTKMPREYEQLFEATKEMGNGRMVAMPMPNMWGWEYRDWGNGDGYEGANFTQFGIMQPLLIRDFDRWSPYNEGFYNEFSTALYGTNQEDVMRVLDKYDVRYVLLDESVLAPGQDKEILRIDETKALAGELGWEEQFHEGFLTVWDTGIATGEQFVSAPESYIWASGDTSKVREDLLYQELKTYVESQSSDHSPIIAQGSELGQQRVVIYPFAGLMREEIKNVEYGEQSATLRSDLVGFEKDLQPTRSDLGEQSLIIPGWQVGDIVRIQYENGEPLPTYYVNGQPGPIFLGKEKPEEGKNIIYARISEGEEWSEYLRNQSFEIRNQEIEIEVPVEPQVYDFGKVGAGTIGNCDVLKRGTAEKQQSSDHSLSQGSELSGTVYTANERGAVCDYVVMPELDTRLSYLMRLQGENRVGRSVKLFLYNTGSKRNDLEYLLGKQTFDQTLSLLPWAWDGYYTLNIETRSFGQYAENTLQPVEVRWLPLEQIARARLQPSRSDLVGIENYLQPTRSDLRITEVKKTGTWLYRVIVEGSGLLKLSQGYDEGWISPDLEHVKVDGWANGWMVNKSGSITIFYWPQLLEYVGFVMLGLTAWVVVKSKRHED